MGHHAFKEQDGYHIMTMTYTGYTVTLVYPAIRVLTENKLVKLVELLEQEGGHVVMQLCYDLLNTASYLAHEGGVVQTENVFLDCVQARGAKGFYQVPMRFKQGSVQLEEALAGYEGDTIQQISVVSSIEVYLVYTDEAFTHCLGVMRIPFAKLKDLGEACKDEQGISFFSN